MSRSTRNLILAIQGPAVFAGMRWCSPFKSLAKPNGFYSSDTVSISRWWSHFERLTAVGHQSATCCHTAFGLPDQRRANLMTIQASSLRATTDAQRRFLARRSNAAWIARIACLLGLLDCLACSYLLAKYKYGLPDLQLACTNTNRKYGCMVRIVSRSASRPACQHSPCCQGAPGGEVEAGLEHPALLLPGSRRRVG